MKSKKAFVNIVLNAHLPYIREPENENFFEEDWFYEAATESYLPLIRNLKALDERGVNYRLTIAISPSLVEMMKDPLLQNRLLKYIDKHIELGEKEVARLKDDPQFLPVATDILNEYKTAKYELESLYKGSVLNAFLSLPSNKVEFITMPATHPFLPLYESRPSLINSSFVVSEKVHSNAFRKKPRGVWLPLGGYFPGLDTLIKKNLITADYFFALPSSVALSPDSIKRGCYAPIRTESSMLAFPLDSSLQNKVTSTLLGYPGDDDYKEFYRDIGYDLPFSYIGEYVHGSENRGFTGYKYYSVSGKRETKNIYNKEKAAAKCALHAFDFVHTIEEKLSRIENDIDVHPVFSVAFDAELLGHWWKEGAEWLRDVLTLLEKSERLTSSTCSYYLRSVKGEWQSARLAYPSLSNGTYMYPYLDGENNSLLRLIFSAIDTTEDLVMRFKTEKNPVKRRYIREAVKNVLLLSSSDWPIILHNKTCPVYVKNRIREHLYNIEKISRLLSHNKSDTPYLVKAEKKYPLFEGLDFSTFAP